MLYLYSGLRSWVGLGEATQRQNQNSCHTRVSSDRHPAALAIDIRLSEATSPKSTLRSFTVLAHWLGIINFGGAAIGPEEMPHGEPLIWAGIPVTWRVYVAVEPSVALSRAIKVRAFSKSLFASAYFASA